MIRTSSLFVAAVFALAACSVTSQGTDTTTTAVTPGAETTLVTAPAAETTTTTTPAAASPLSASELGELFLAALNSGDAVAVAALAPSIASQDLQDVIGTGPYESVDCLVLDGRDVCGIAHENAAYDFVLDLSTGLVTEIYYTGGG